MFQGISLNPDGTTTEQYNVQVDRGTSTNTNPVVGGSVIAWNPSVQTGGNLGVAIAEWPAGTTIGGGTALAGYRMLFNGGSREPDGGAVTQAGVMDLTPMGQQLFLNAVDHVLAVPEPSSLWLAAIGLLLLAYRVRR